MHVRCAAVVETVWSGRFPAARLFCTCWLVYAVHWAPFVVREHLPAITLAESGTLNVQPFLGWSPDVFAGPRGGAFINNNPGASLLGAVPLLLGRPLFAVVEQWTDPSPSERLKRAEPSTAVQPRRQWYFWAVAFLTSAFLMAPISALAVTTFGLALGSAGIPRNAALGGAVFLAFGTPVFLRTGYLNHNLLVGHAALFAAVLLWNHGRRIGSAGAAGAGAIGGYAVLCDFSGLLVLGVAGIYAWLRAGDGGAGFRERLRVGSLYAIGAAPPLLALAVYQSWAFGYAALPSQHFMTAIEQTSRGYRGITWPSLDLALMNFFDPTFGLFAVCPVLAVGLAAPLVRRGPFRLQARETWLILAFFCAFVLFCASNQYSRLQGSTGIRYLVPTVPGLALLTLQVLRVLPSPIRWTLFILSVVPAWLAAMAHAPLGDFVRNPTDLELSWIRRMAEYGVIDHPLRLTVLVLLGCAVAVFALWWRDRPSVQ